jgi:hypothetical protein
LTAAHTLTLIGRTYCHLCDEMANALRPLAAAHGARVVVLDADADPMLEAAYGERVPVLVLGEPLQGAELCHYRLDTARVVAALAAAGEAAGEPEIC